MSADAKALETSAPEVPPPPVPGALALKVEMAKSILTTGIQQALIAALRQVFGFSEAQAFELVTFVPLGIIIDRATGNDHLAEGILVALGYIQGKTLASWIEDAETVRKNRQPPASPSAVTSPVQVEEMAAPQPDLAVPGSAEPNRPLKPVPADSGDGEKHNVQEE